jgi:hypothetical protein
MAFVAGGRAFVVGGHSPQEGGGHSSTYELDLFRRGGKEEQGNNKEFSHRVKIQHDHLMSEFQRT